MGPAPVRIVITGASAGVGRALARSWSRPGNALGLLARGVDGLAATEREARAAGAAVVCFPVDVADAAAVDAAAEHFERTHGPIDLWINNAMVSVFSPVIGMTAAEYRRVTEVTYLGVVHGTLAALRRMRVRDHGCIMQIGSALAFRGIPLQSAYCAAKHAIQGFTESLRAELLHDRSRIHLGIVHLPAVNTPQFGWVKSRLPHAAQPVPPIYQPELIAEAVAYAVRHRIAEVHLGFSTVLAIAASRLAPRLVDRYLARTGYASQQTREPADPSRPHNLWQPVPGDHGARGAFSRQARSRSWWWWLQRHGWLLLMLLALIGLAVVAAFSGRI